MFQPIRVSCSNQSANVGTCEKLVFMRICGYCSNRSKCYNLFPVRLSRARAYARTRTHAHVFIFYFSWNGWNGWNKWLFMRSCECSNHRSNLRLAWNNHKKSAVSRALVSHFGFKTRNRRFQSLGDTNTNNSPLRLYTFSF